MFHIKVPYVISRSVFMLSDMEDNRLNGIFFVLKTIEWEVESITSNWAVNEAFISPKFLKVSSISSNVGSGIPDSVSNTTSGTPYFSAIARSVTISSAE